MKRVKKLLASLCCVAILISMLPVLPASAAELLSEDFESFALGSDYTGEGLFVKADLPYEGTVSRAIGEREGNKYLILSTQAASATSTQARNRMRTAQKIGGTFTVEWDVNQMTKNQLSTYIRGADIRVNVAEGGAVQLYAHAGVKVDGVMESKNAGFSINPNSWYTFKVEVSDELMTLSVYDKSFNNAMIGTATMTQSSETKPDLFEPNTIWFDMTSTKGSDAMGNIALDNIYITEGTYEGVKSAPHSVVPGSTHNFDVPKSTKADAYKVLVIGDDGGRDAAWYLPELARQTGKELSVGLAYLEQGTIRNHAYFSAKYMEEYEYYKGCDTTSYAMTRVGGDAKVSLNWIIAEEKWDAIVLQQGVVLDGIFGSYTGFDLDYMLDMFADLVPQAKIYWHMNWAMSDDYTTNSTDKGFNVRSDYDTYYNNDSAYHYNAIIDCLNEYVLTEPRFAGVIYSGYAVENVRNTTLGREITRDGQFLNKGGRLAAAMTTLKTLQPTADLNKLSSGSVASMLSNDSVSSGTYVNNDANFELVRQAVTAALGGNPVKRTPTNVQPSSTAEGIVVVDQSEVPIMLRFPNMTIMDDGTMFITAIDSVSHKSEISTDRKAYLKEGPQRTFLYKSTDSGKTWNRTGFVFDHRLMEEWGIYEVSNRYEQLKKNPYLDYIVYAPPGDTNLFSAHVDIDDDGEKENILIMTFWWWYYRENGNATTSRCTYLTYSTDQGETWEEPVKIDNGLKRGDITEFDDGTILVPLYSRPQAVRMEFKNGKWTELYRSDVPNTSPTESTAFSEISFISPRGDDTVYCLVRESGALLRSDDAGKTWTEVGNEPGLIHQPAFCRLDDGRVFAVWAKVASPRIILGKMYYPGSDWSETETQVIIDMPQMKQDAGNPFCATLPNGNVYVVGYDTYYRSILGTEVDVSDPAYLPRELKDETATVIYSEDTGDKQLSDDGVSYTAIPGSYTTWLDFTPADETSSVTVQTAVGNVVIKTDELDIAGTKSALNLTRGVLTHARVSVVGYTINVKVWQDENWVQGSFDDSLSFDVTKLGKMPTEYAYGVGTEGTNASPAITGSNAILHSWKLTKNMVVSFTEAAVTQVGSPDLELKLDIAPAQEYTLTSSDPAVATVVDGKVHAVAPGIANIVLDVCGVKRECAVTVREGSLELKQDVQTTVIAQDDFEQYTVGEDAFWREMGKHGYASNVTDKGENCALDVAEEDGNQYLVLRAKNKGATWHKVTQQLTGDYTVQFDYRYDPKGTSGSILYMTFWQDSVINERTMLHDKKVQFGFTPVRTDQKNGEENININVPGDVSSPGWHTFKAIRLNGSIMVKHWVKGRPEPEQWSAVLSHSVLDTSQTSTFRMQYYGRNAEDSILHIDNFSITQNVEKNNSAQKLAGLGLMGGVGTNADGSTNFDLYRAPNRAEAIVMLLRLLGKESEVNKGGWSHPFTDVPAWANNWVGYAYQHKLTSGIGNNKFGSNDVATGAMYTTFVLRALGYSDAAGEFSWDKPHTLAAKCGLIDANDSLLYFPRGSLADVSFTALGCKMKDGTPLYEKLTAAGAFVKEHYQKIAGEF